MKRQGIMDGDGNTQRAAVLMLARLFNLWSIQTQLKKQWTDYMNRII